MQGVTKAARMANGRSRACAKCHLKDIKGICLPHYQKACSDAFIEGFKKGAEWREKMYEIRIEETR